MEDTEQEEALFAAVKESSNSHSSIKLNIPILVIIRLFCYIGIEDV